MHQILSIHFFICHSSTCHFIQIYQYLFCFYTARAYASNVNQRIGFEMVAPGHIIHYLRSIDCSHKILLLLSIILSFQYFIFKEAILLEINFTPEIFYQVLQTITDMFTELFYEIITCPYE